MNKFKPHLALIALFILETMQLAQLIGMQYLSSNYSPWLIIVNTTIQGMSFYLIHFVARNKKNE